jgi:hypothetical protein
MPVNKKVRPDDGRRGNTGTRKYSDEAVEQALELASVIGIREAAKQLGINPSTLSAWTRSPTWLQRWSELRKHNAPKWREKIAVPMEDLVSRYVALQERLVEKFEEEVDNLDPRDLGNSLRSLAVAMGVTTDKAERLRDRPDTVVEHKISAAQLERAMERLLGESVDSTATEIVDAKPLAELEEGEVDDLG